MHPARRLLFGCLAGLVVLGLVSLSAGDDKEKEKPKRRPDVPYVPTPQAAVEKMLEVAKLTKDDVVYDLGCGDGRIVVTAAKKYGCKAVGIDIDPKRVKEAKANVKKNDVEKLVEIREGDALKVEDIGKATVVTLYMLPEVNLKLRPILKKELKPGTRVVSHDFDMGTWEPDKTFTVKAKTDDGDDKDCDILLWTIREGADKDKEPDVIYVPTPQAVVDKMLEMAQVTKGDVVFDLGCGDGRIPVTAAKKYGCKAFGFDVDPRRIEESLANVKKNEVEKLVTIKKQDIFELDLSEANVVTLYLLEELNVKLVPQLQKMKRGSRVVSHDFKIEGYVPDKHITMRAKGDTGRERDHEIFLFTVPLKKEAEKQ